MSRIFEAVRGGVETAADYPGGPLMSAWTTPGGCLHVSPGLATYAQVQASTDRETEYWELPGDTAMQGKRLEFQKTCAANSAQAPDGRPGENKEEEEDENEDGPGKGGAASPVAHGSTSNS